MNVLESRMLTLTLFLLCLTTKRLSASFNTDELNSINYEVDILNVPVKIGEERDSPVMLMKSKYGQDYECLLPQLELKDEILDFSESATVESSDIKDLLQPLQNAPCLIKTKDWWTYELCYGHYIKQYHVEDSKIVGQVITLGLYDSDFDWDNETNKDKSSENRQKRYHSQYYNNGSKCDLTGQPRNAEIRFFCEEDSGDYIHRVDEPGTCSYLITVHTSRICNHPYLKPLPSNKPQVISCSPLLDSEQYQIYIEKVEEDKRKAEEKRKVWLAEQQERLKKLKTWAQQQRLKLGEEEKTEEETKKSELTEVQTDTIVDDDDKSQAEITKADKNLESSQKDEDESVVEITNVDKDDDEDILEEFEKELSSMSQEEKAVLANYKKDIQKEISKQFNDLIEEAEEELQQEMDTDIRDATFSKLASTLNKLIEKLDKAEKDVAVATKALEKAKSAIIYEKKNDATDKGDSETEVPEDSATLDEEEGNGDILNLEDNEGSKEESATDDGRLRVHIRRLGQGKQGKGKLQLLRHHGLEGKQKEKLEKAVKEKLEQAGLDTNGRRIEVKIITAGYYDDEEGKDFHVLSDEETQQFQSMILTLLTGNQEAVQEMERQRRMEKNYHFVWGENGRENEEEE
ncbi:protein OS-9-like [Centruroides vittatus]|uniref:protein OS-9-like n=1 Tax=Centruroides vittatus TaxID=120091 RepID=UPI0035100ED9